MNAFRPPRHNFSRRAFLTLLGGGAAGMLCHRVAASIATEPDVIGQQKVGAAACGPCALANALANGDAPGRRAFRQLPGNTPDARVTSLIARFGAKPSETYGPRRARFSADAGLTTEDMPFLVNDTLAASGLTRARGDWLDQLPNEDERAHLRRVQALLTASLARGLPPVVEVRAFSADPSAGRSSSPSWVNLYAHWLALVAVEPMTLPPKASGFLCHFADSYTGRVIPGFAFAELYRPFMATRGFSLKADGTKDWHWLTGHPFILLDLPDVPLTIQSRPWHERTFVALTYAVCRAAS